MGEGAAILVLEAEEHAVARGVRVYAELVSAAITSDAFHAVAPDPTATGVIRAIETALRIGNIDPRDVMHVNDHATSTSAGDLAEAIAIRRALGTDADHVVVSATKSMTGHLLGAAGALESVFCVLTVYDRLAPPTINLRDLDPAVDLEVVRGTPRCLPTGDIVALNDSFGFGGHNVAVAFRSI